MKNRGVAAFTLILIVTAMAITVGVSYYFIENTTSSSVTNQPLNLVDAPLPTYADICTYLSTDIFDNYMPIDYPRDNIVFSEISLPVIFPTPERQSSTSLTVSKSYGVCTAIYNDLNKYNYNNPYGRFYSVEFTAYAANGIFFINNANIYYSFLKQLPSFIRSHLGSLGSLTGEIDAFVGNKYKDQIQAGAKDLQGVGDKAWWFKTAGSLDDDPNFIDNVTGDQITLYFVKDHLPYILHVKGVYKKTTMGRGVTELELNEAINIAKALIPKLPKYNEGEFASSTPSKTPPTLTATRSTTNISQINLSWTDSSSDITGYQIKRATAPNDDTIIANVGVATAYVDDLNTVKLLNDHESYAVRAVYADGTYSGYSNVVEVSNCVLVPGSKSGNLNKIVFIETYGMYANIDNYAQKVNSDIDALLTVEPYKTYRNNFSFYIDLKSAPTPPSSNAVAGVGSYYQFAVNPMINYYTSSCSNGSPETDAVYFAQKGYTPVQTVQFGKTIFLQDNASPVPFIYGLSRTFGLNNESIWSTTGNFDQSYNYPGPQNTNYTLYASPVNCSLNPSNDYRGLNNRIYGSIVDKGCTYLNNGASPHSMTYYRPSETSIMNQDFVSIKNSPVSGLLDNTDLSKFNVIDCGYIIAAISGQKVNKVNAATHWSQCFNLDTAGKSEI